MRKLVLFSISAICFTASSLVQGEIVDIKSATEIRNHAEGRKLVIFDIDNTILEPVQELGRDEWFYHRLKTHQKSGLTNEKALEKAVAEWEAVQHITSVRLVEPSMAPLIKDLQDKKMTVIGLTTRGSSLARTTIKQLKTLGIDLSATAPHQNDIFFLTPSDVSAGMLFKGGVLFTGGLHKGESFEKLLKQFNKRPESVLFINDKASHLAEIEQYCLRENIPFMGLRYGYVDERVADFRGELADVQWRHFGTILSDEDAKKLLEVEKKKNQP